MGFHNALGAQVLGAPENMEPQDLQHIVIQRREKVGDHLGIGAEGLGTAAHLHARGLQLEIRIDPQGHGHPVAPLPGELHDPLGFRGRFQNDDDSRFHRGLEVLGGFAGSGEADVAGVDAGRQCDAQLRRGGDIQAIGQACEMRDHRRHRIGFHRVVQADARR